MDTIPLQEDHLMRRCCIRDETAPLGPLRETNYTGAKKNIVTLKRPARRARLASRMPYILRRSSMDLMATFAKSLYTSIELNNGDDDKNCLPRCNSASGRATKTQEMQVVTNEYSGQVQSQERFSTPSPIGDEGREPSDTTNIDAALSEHRHTNLSSEDLRLEVEHTPSEDALALEVGNNAFEYLEECFCTEVSVLNREKFNAIPEIVKSDLTVTGYLGKGCFNDVFEVVWKDGQLRTKTSDRISGDNQSNRRHPVRGGRAALSCSITMTTSAARTSCAKRQHVFALKCLRPQIRSNANQFTIGAEDLVHETAILASLDHRHIIKLHGRTSGHLSDAFVFNDGYFIILDRLNETLHERIDAWKTSHHQALLGPTVKQLEVARSIADAVSYLHSKNIVFRDLKPDNVGFDSTGVLKLFDFGFAIGLPEKDASNPAGFLFDVCGTPRYMAPEVGLSIGYGLKSDMYSFGILLWEICALSTPFSSITSPSEFERIVFAEGTRPMVKNYWPSTLQELLRSCWAANPRERPARWMEVKSSLLSAINCITSDNRSPNRAVRLIGRLDGLICQWK